MELSIPYKLKQLIDLTAQRNYLFTYDGKVYGPLLDIPKALVVYTRGSAYRDNSLIPLSFDHQAPYIDFWLRMIGVRELRSVIVDNAWNLDDAESAASLAAGKRSVEEISRTAIPPEHRRLLAAYRMPAEWEQHLACYLAWPHNRDTWPGKFEVIPPIYAEMVAKIARFEPVRLAVTDASQLDEVRAMIRDAARRTETEAPGPILPIDIFHLPTNDAWARDHGPIFVNRLANAAAGGPNQIALDWRFNSWGEKYGAFNLDDVVPQKLGLRFGFEVIEPGIVLEGGSIDVNGAGSLLTTESCLLNPNRNSTLSRADIEDYLRAYLGVTNVLWLGDGIAGDDTDGHIDDLARFVAPDTVVTVLEDDPADVNYKVLRDNLERLRAMRDQDGRPFKIETLPMPPPVVYDNTRLPASYANFYIANGAVLMPTFNAPTDARAAATLARLFPGRRVVSIPSTDLVWGLGSVHCLSQQHPAP